MKRPLAAVLAVLVATSSVATPVNDATAAPADGTLTVKVVRDVNGNGTYEQALEVGVPGAVVLVTDPDGHTAKGTTGGSGTVDVDLGPVTGGKYRVQVDPPAGSVLRPAPAGATLESNTMFVDVSGGNDVSVITGLWNPADYCQSSPRLVTACQRGAIRRNGDDNLDPDSRALVSFPFTERGTTPPTQVVNQGAVGTVHGLAYRKQDKRIFSGAFAKRLADYGPSGPGAVYVTDSNGATTLFTTVPDAGTASHDHQKNFDGDFFAVPGKQSLGDVDISEDGSELYVVNLNDRKLYVYDATGPTAAAPKGSYVIPAAACATAGDWRPGALGVRDGVLHVGGVCSGEASQNRADVKAVVYTFKGGAFSAPLLTKTLDFPRGMVKENRPNSDKWYAWSDDWAASDQFGLGHTAYPQPLMADIGVENNGDLVLGFRDRFGDQGGYKIKSPDGSNPRGEYEAMSGGDLNRACRRAGGSYAWEGEQGCPNNHNGRNGGDQPRGVAEFYAGEYFCNANNVCQHMETAQGALAMLYGENRMPATAMDPVDERSGGIGWFDRADGSMQNVNHDNGYRIHDQDTEPDAEGWGKANGLGDLEALCDLAPVQLGDRVWFDVDGDGNQDGGEPPVEGVGVTATPCDGGPAPAAKITDATGRYRFGGADAAGLNDGLRPDTCYNVTFDYSRVDTAKLPGSPALADLGWTPKDVGRDDLIDSDVDATGARSVKSDAPGGVQHGVDAGLTVLGKLGDLVWDDVDKDGVRDLGEPGVQGVTVVLRDAGGKQVGQAAITDARGGYQFSKLVDGSYKVCFDLRQLAGQYAGYGFTTKDVPGNDATDSDAEPADGCTATTTLGAGRREDSTLDAGLVPPNNEIGDIVWADNNRDGLRDPGEPGVPGVTVTLKDSNDAVVGLPEVTDRLGGYLFDGLKSGAYRVCSDLKNLPAPYTSYLPTRPDAGDDAKDSDSGADGCTKPTTVGGVKRQDLTLDAGIRPPNVLGDLVWNDTDKNGRRDPGEPGVQGVRVALQNEDGSPVGVQATTDEDGGYEFPNLPDGTYRVCLDLKNLPAAVVGYRMSKPNAGDDGVDSDADVATGCTPTTTLNVDNPEDRTLDAGLGRPVNRLGDHVWIDADENGRQDPGERPVSDVTVKLSTGATTKTDGNGDYLFDDLPDGSYAVCLELTNLPAAVADYEVTRRDAADDEYDSDADPATGCVPSRALAGDREDLSSDVGLVAPPNRLGDRVWLDTNNNGIQDGGEPGVPNMPVKLSTGAATTTDTAGNYLLPGLPDGEHVVCFGPMPPQFADHQFTKPNAGDHRKDSDAGTSGCAPAVALGGGKRETLTVDAGIRPPVNRLGDRVWIDSNSNGLQDADEQPVSNVTVRLNNGAVTKTGTTGEYLFDDLPDGYYYVCVDTATLPPPVADYRVTKPDAGSGDVADAIDSDAGPATACTHVVKLGKDNREDLTLDAGLVAPPNKIGDRVWSDRNHNGVQDPSEPGVPGVLVELVDLSGKPVGDPVWTNPDGEYAFPGIPDGTYAVCFGMTELPVEYAEWLATKPNAGGESAESDGRDSNVDPASGCTTPVTVGVEKRENRTLDLGLVPPTNRIGDRVWYDDNSNGIQDKGEPGVPNLPVYLQDGSGRPVASTKTDSDGKYMLTELPDGGYKVCFNADPRTHLVEGRRLTKPNADDHLPRSGNRDSDADPVSGCTDVVRLGEDGRVDMSLDAGLQPMRSLAATNAFQWSLVGLSAMLLLGGSALAFMGSRRRKDP